MASDWDWIFKTNLGELGGSLVFARGASPERVMDAYGMDPAAARFFEADPNAIYKWLPYPEADDDLVARHPWIRVGTTGEWGFAIDETGGAHFYEEEFTDELSAGTDLALFAGTMTIDYFSYVVDGVEVTSFEPLRAWERFGADPDRFLAQMRRVGLAVDRPAEVAEIPEMGTRIAMLEMLTSALGIRLPGEVALGPLLTVQRGPEPYRQPGEDED